MGIVAPESEACIPNCWINIVVRVLSPSLMVCISCSILFICYSGSLAERVGVLVVGFASVGDLFYH